MNQPLPSVKPDSVLRERLHQNQGVINRLHDLLLDLEGKLDPVLTPSESISCNTVKGPEVGPAMSEFEAVLVTHNDQLDALGVRIHKLLNRLAV